MKGKQETFAGRLSESGYRYDLKPLFDDFLTLTLCAFSQNPLTGKSYDEDLYLETVGRYPKELARELFPQLLALLVEEMEERRGSSEGSDVLGEFYEENFCKRGSGQFFTPWHICLMMAQCLGTKEHEEPEERLRILDPSCGSGRTLLAAGHVYGWQHRYFGIDIDHTCVKMTAINLFLNGIFHGEVMWADALNPSDFRMSYKLSFLPFGIFRIQENSRSHLWHSQQALFRPKKMEIRTHAEITLPSEEGGRGASTTQLQLF